MKRQSKEEQTTSATTTQPRKSNVIFIILATFMIFFGCCTNVIALELILHKDPQAGGIVTLIQFLVIAIEGFISQVTFKNGFGFKKRAIPIWYHLILVTVFFVSSIINNYAFGFQISMPLHSIFRSGSLAMNMIFGIVVFGDVVPMRKILSVIFITIGIIITTLASSQNKEKVFNEEFNFSKWIIGIIMLSVGLVISSLMGKLQELGYRKWPHKDYKQNMFYAHALALPYFLLLFKELPKHFIIFSQSEYIVDFIPIPSLWIYMAINVISQYICISGVYWLTSQTNSLTSTLAVTVRKFVSLLISIAYFKNEFTIVHWIGTILVFGGSLFYILGDEKKEKKEEKEKKE